MDDLELWDAEQIQQTLLDLPRHFFIRREEFFGEEGWKGIQERLANNKAGAKHEPYKALWKFIQLMRLQGDHEAKVADSLIEEWPKEEQVGGHWGNDFEPSMNPKNANGKQNTVSPKPANNYRNVVVNWPGIAHRLMFWEPEKMDNPTPDRIARLEKRDRRLHALEQFEAIDSLKAGFFTRLAEDIRAKEKVIEESMKKNQLEIRI